MLWRRVDSDDFGIVLFFDLFPPHLEELKKMEDKDQPAEDN